MGASSTGLKSYRSDRVEDRNSQSTIPRMSVDDLENNNSHIFVNPQDENDLNLLPIHALLDKRDLNNNNRATTLINHNIFTVSLSSPLATTLSTSFNECDKLALYQLSEPKVKVKQEKMVKGNSTKKSSKKKCDEKLMSNEKNKKKEKPKSKPPRAPAGSGVGGKRGTAEQDQMMRRPRKKTNTKTEK